MGRGGVKLDQLLGDGKKVNHVIMAVWFGEGNLSLFQIA